MRCNDLATYLIDCDANSNFLLRKLEEYAVNNVTKGKKYFCLIPYINPVREKILAQYYEVLQEEKFTPEKNLPSSVSIDFTPLLTKENYVGRVRDLKKEIQAGNIYEVNFCTEFTARAEIDPLAVFIKLREISKAPYACLAKLGCDYIISASPELFLKKSGRTLITKPIKGTAKRGSSLEEDERLKAKLQNNVKERTENVMAVDVARNDFSRLAESGSVRVNKLYNIETFETVHQMVSTVSCELRNEKNLEDILEATFPMASMTGAPKVSAMNFIDRYEGFNRNFYSGAMGLIDKNGDFEFSVNIRCIFYNEETKKISIAVGSAITHLSDPEEEYQECLLKAEALLRALNGKLLSS